LLDASIREFLCELELGLYLVNISSDLLSQSSLDIDPLLAPSQRALIMLDDIEVTSIHRALESLITQVKIHLSTACDYEPGPFQKIFENYLRQLKQLASYAQYDSTVLHYARYLLIICLASLPSVCSPLNVSLMHLIHLILWLSGRVQLHVRLQLCS
jgi:hypothetical protein